jgi:hypothetical protein
LHASDKATDLNKYWKRLFANVSMSSRYGASGARELKNPKAQKELHHEITITIDDLKEQWYKQEGKCYWLGIDMSLEDLFVSRSPFAVSVDRIDSSGGYSKNNIVLTTRFANVGRGAYQGEDFQERLTSLISKKFNSAP